MRRENPVVFSFDGGTLTVYGFMAVGGILLFLLLFLTAGCGKKAMPVAPHQSLPPRVSDLKGKVEGAMVVLAWTIPKRTRETAAPLTAVLYRAKQALSDSACLNCPPRFEPIARLPVSTDKSSAMRYVDPLEEGFRYTYRVVLETQQHVNGEASNPFDTIF